LPSPETVEDIERAARLHGIRSVAVQHAQQAFASRLEASLGDGDLLVAERLRPALMALYAVRAVMRVGFAFAHPGSVVKVTTV